MAICTFICRSQLLCKGINLTSEGVLGCYKLSLQLGQMVLDFSDVVPHSLVLDGDGTPDVLESVEGFIGTGHKVIMLEDKLIRRFNQLLRRVLTFFSLSIILFNK